MLRASAVAAANTATTTSQSSSSSRNKHNLLFRKQRSSSSSHRNNNHHHHHSMIFRIVVGAFLTAAILLMILLLWYGYGILVVQQNNKPTTPSSSPIRGSTTKNHNPNNTNPRPQPQSSSFLRPTPPQKEATTKMTTLPSTKEEASQIIAQIRKDFSERYGSYAPTLLEKGVQVFGSIDATAHRMIQAWRQQRPFVMAFTGYSVTVGRGNYFNQSFPFVLQGILQEPLQQVLGISLQVQNAAIGGIPSFPYSFCLEHFVGLEADVLSWDYSMNEGKSAASLEAFIRQALQQLPHHPMIILLDRQASRQAVLQDYTTKLGLVPDALMVGRKEDIWGSDSDLPPTLISSQEKAAVVLPPGFQDWNVFGAPPKCPGHGNWHPKQQEHAMIGWMMGMHFVNVLERAHAILWEAGGKDDVDVVVPSSLSLSSSPIVFPKPLSPKLPSNNPAVNELLFGHEVAPNQYHMKDLSCRTSFVPATDASKTLPSIVVQGTAESFIDLDIMVDRTLRHYQEGWIMDVSPVERKTKRQVERCGGLGYQDMKIALYGIPESGTLRLWLPYEPKQHTATANHHEEHDHDDDMTDAHHWFDDFLICEANEKRPDSACQLHHDLEIVVGGVRVVDTIQPVNGVAEYLKRKTCVNVGIPPGAQITPLGAITTMDGQTLSEGDKVRLFDGPDESVGLLVDITAKSKVTLANGACCLSHIVWEMH